MKIYLTAAALVLAACTEAPPRPMDEVPRQSVLPNGDREYGFASGCRITVEPQRAVEKARSGDCASHHLDIALLYAAGD